MMKHKYRVYYITPGGTLHRSRLLTNTEAEACFMGSDAILRTRQSWRRREYILERKHATWENDNVPHPEAA